MRKSIDNVNKLDSQAGAVPAGGDVVLEAIHGVMHRFRALQYQVLRDGPHDVTHMDSKVMGFFARCPGATLSDLAQHSGRDKAQLARLVKGLRERGLLDAESDPIDRRSVHLRLSEAGRKVHHSLRAQARALGARAVVGIEPAERAQLVALLGRLEANLDRQD